MLMCALLAHGDDRRPIHTAEEGGVKSLTADYVVTIENHVATVFDVNEVFDNTAGATMRRMPPDLDSMRRYTLAFMLEVAAHYHDDHAMFVIITDEYPSPFEYKAFVKRLTPKDVTPVVKPRKKI